MSADSIRMSLFFRVTNPLTLTLARRLQISLGTVERDCVSKPSTISASNIRFQQTHFKDGV